MPDAGQDGSQHYFRCSSLNCKQGMLYICTDSPTLGMAMSLAFQYHSPASGCQVPPGHVWLQGDNSLNSTDSRHYGPVPYALVEGRAFVKVCAGGHTQTHFVMEAPLCQAGTLLMHQPPGLDATSGS